MPLADTIALPLRKTRRTDEPQLSVIVCTYDRYNVLPGAIASLQDQSVPAGTLEIIVVDNSPDRLAAALFGVAYNDTEHLRYLVAPQPGLSDARNQGTEAARGKIVAFIDDDAIASPGWAAGMLDAFSKLGPRIGAVGGPARPLWLADRPAWLTDNLLGHLSILDHGPKLRVLPAGETIMGCNMAFDRDLLRHINGFPTHLGRHGPDLALRSNGEPGVLDAVRQNGRDIGYTPHAAIDHCIDPARLTQTWFRRRAAWQAVSDYLMNPAATAAHAQAATRHLQLVQTSNTRARPVGFFGHEQSGQALTADLLLIRELIIATLHGGATLNPNHNPTAIQRTQAAAALGLRGHLRPAARWLRRWGGG
jgi:hypothetical protein